jgi:hypothetical protein
MPFVCPVCGYPSLSELPRPREGGGSFEICPSCGFQFGVTDDDLGLSFDEWRTQWIEQGMPWDKGRTDPPANWDPIAQLRNVGCV